LNKRREANGKKRERRSGKGLMRSVMVVLMGVAFILLILPLIKSVKMRWKEAIV